jgi:hypothetical protein
MKHDHRIAAAVALATGLLLWCLSTQTPFSAVTSAADGSCTAQQAAEAGRLIPTAQSWERLHSLFTSYGQCDDGVVGERFSQAVSQLLISRWDHLSDLRRLSARGPDFQQFVLRHVDESVPAERLRALNALANSKCPQSEADFCKSLVERLREL